MRTVTLEKLIELKLASGMTGAGRRKDLGDVQELMRALGLGADMARLLDPWVRDMYLELLAELQTAAGQTDAPDRDG